MQETKSISGMSTRACALCAVLSACVTPARSQCPWHCWPMCRELLSIHTGRVLSRDESQLGMGLGLVSCPGQFLLPEPCAKQQEGLLLCSTSHMHSGEGQLLGSKMRNMAFSNLEECLRRERRKVFPQAAVKWRREGFVLGHVMGRKRDGRMYRFPNLPLIFMCMYGGKEVWAHLDSWREISGDFFPLCCFDLKSLSVFPYIPPGAVFHRWADLTQILSCLLSLCISCSYSDFCGITILVKPVNDVTSIRHFDVCGGFVADKPITILVI